jgi:hypothetical protein
MGPMFRCMPLALSTTRAEPRSTEPPSTTGTPSRTRGMTFGHEVLVALIMAIAMGATVFLYR